MTLRPGTIAACMALAVAAPAWAQAPAPSASPRPSAQQPTGVSKQISGTIQTVQGDKVTLADGTELTIPGRVMVQQRELQPGVSMKASYEDRGGEKVVTSLQLEPGK